MPFCRKPKRFSKSYITKITNQVLWIDQVLSRNKEWCFEAVGWRMQ